MIESWRWFGPDDPVTLSDVRQAGATGIVTALHGVPADTPWRREDIATRQEMIRDAGLEWVVVESIPVHESIKTGATGWEAMADVWAESLRAVAAEGITTVCYNFMPVLDWTRTALDHALADGAQCLRYDAVDAAIFDIFLLKRDGARADHRADIAEEAETRYDGMDGAACQRLTETIIAGLPGAEESWTLDGFRNRIADYREIDAARLRANLLAFLDRVLPVAREAGVKLAIHPDDPPFALFGLPRVVSCAEDLAAILDHAPVAENGLTFCTGSLGVRADNDLPAMFDRFRDRIHFLHLLSRGRASGRRCRSGRNRAAGAASRGRQRPARADAPGPRPYDRLGSVTRHARRLPLYRPAARPGRAARCRRGPGRDRPRLTHPGRRQAPAPPGRQYSMASRNLCCAVLRCSSSSRAARSASLSRIACRISRCSAKASPWLR